jgi:hypothetical protein
MGLGIVLKTPRRVALKVKIRSISMERVIIYALVVLGLILLLAIAAEIALFFQIRCKKEATSGLKRARAVLLCMAGLMLGMVISMAAMMKWQRARVFERISAGPLERLVLRSDREVELVGEAARVVLQLMVNAPRVGPHNSHPTVLCSLEICANGQYFYVLEKDSVREDEYWLLEKSEGSRAHGNPVRQFHSPELTTILRAHGF